MWTWGDALLPDVIVLDPEATATMPAVVTTGTGLDAFVHAVEAAAGPTPMSVGCRPAAASQRSWSATTCRPPSLTGATSGREPLLQEAAYLAGTAIDGCGTGMAHAIGPRRWAACTSVPHGVAVAVGLEAALTWNIGARRPRPRGRWPRPSASISTVLTVWPRPTGRCGAAGGCRPPSRRSLEVGLDPSAVAATIVTEENLPMVRNNCRRPDDVTSGISPNATVAVWTALRTVTAA